MTLYPETQEPPPYTKGMAGASGDARAAEALTAERAARLQHLFKAALRQEPQERAAFLEAACPDDPSLRRELESLLAADNQAEAGGFMDTPAAQLPTFIDDGDDGDLEGRNVGAYTVLRRLGRGGMGDVYLALRDAPFKQYVALKIIRRGMDTRDILQRFEMERQILASLNHPNIARLLDGGTTDDGLAYFVMEHVEGTHITDYCDAHRLSLDERLRLFMAVCRAVHYAHQNLVVHRDLKPSNILVTKPSSRFSREGGSKGQVGRVKLLDFGVAKLLNPTLANVDVPITRTMFRMMTPEYASPEQVRGETLTTASDIYALGVLLYELLTGHRPHRLESGSPQEIERMVCEQDPERPSTKVTKVETITRGDGSTETITPAAVSDARAVPLDRLRRRLRGDLDNIVMMALRKEATRRYASAEQFAADIERYLDGMPVEARPNTVGYRVRKFVRRHQVVVAAVCIVVISLAAGLGAAVWQAREARQERDRAEQALVQSEAVSDFLIDLFEASDPGEALGEETTARELLARGLTRLENLDEQPLVQAEMFNVLGRVYRNLGQYDKARPPLERALALRRTVLGDEHDDVAESANNLSLLLRRMGDYDAAEELLREAIAIYRKRHGDESGHVAITTNNLALLKRYQGDYASAEALYRESLDRYLKLTGNRQNRSVVSGLNNLGVFLRHAGAYAEADSLLREALAIRRRIRGEEHPLVALSLDNLGGLLRQTGNFTEAETLIREAFAMRRRLLDANHPRIAQSMNSLGMLHYKTGDYAGADSLLRGALARRRAQLGEEHPDVARSMHNVALLTHAQGDLATAEPLYRDALAMQRKLLGRDHPDVVSSLNGLASLLKDKGDYTAAEPFYLDALNVARQHLREEHLSTQQARNGLVDLYTAWGKPAEAARYRDGG